jgi:glycosyltransferase involved in cell wall biosynthesis
MDTGQNTPEITVILPAYNEEGAIGELVRDIRSRYPDYEVLVVNDASEDQTATLAMQEGARVISHPYRMGNGAAVKTGIRHASGDLLILMDGDGQHRPEDIAQLLQHRHYDMVVGARGKNSQGRSHRNLANRVFSLLASYVSKFRVEDLTSGFRLLSKQTVGKFLYLLPNSFSYPSTITLAYLRSGRSIKYVPITALQRRGKSKIKLFRDGTRFLLIIIKIATLYSPLRIFLPVSIFFFCTGLSYYLYTFSTKGRFTNMGVLLFSTSVIIFMIGLVSEQVCQMNYARSEEYTSD